MLTLSDGRNELWQWDTNRKLTVDADCSQVHFSNKVFGRSIDVDVIDGVAVIPDILLQTDKDLNVWAFVGTAESGYTKISKTFKVNRRNKPADYVFTPTDQTSLEEIKEKIEYLESIQDPGAIKNAVEDYLEENPVESPVKSVNGQTGKIELSAKDVGAISQDDLQEATNEALAQAKESGEFDGEPGKDGAPGLDGQDYVLTEEDKAEIAELAAELVEIPEGSGGGIAVTGAIVGQTVKIAAVDEEGVPTAWEPVDLPSGGVEEWELINSLTIDEDGISVITISSDANGNSYQLKEMRVFILLSQVDAPLALYFKVVCDKDLGGNHRSMVGIGQNVANQTIVGHFTPLGGWVGKIGASTVTDCCDRSYNDEPSLHPITKINITTATWNNQTMWVGSKFYFYGVRA